jgi:hypothetical protein
MAGSKFQVPNARSPQNFKGQLPGLIAILIITTEISGAEAGQWSGHLPGMNHAAADAVS